MPAPVGTGRAGTAPGRRYDLDWLRVIAFGILIFYHIGMFYVTWGWHIKSPHASPLLEPAMALVNPWRLALLFFISGVAIRFAADRMPLARFAPRRFLHLFVPIVFGMLVIVPPQTYLELRFRGVIDPGVWDFYRDYLRLEQVYPVITPTWNHLWYVVYILVYTMILVPLVPLLRRLADGPAGRAMAWLESGSLGWRLLLVPAVPFVVYRLWLAPQFPTTHALVDDWANHAASFTMLLWGYLAAKSPAFWRAVDRALPMALAFTVAAGAALAAIRANWQAIGDDAMLAAGAQTLRTLYAWAAIVAVLGLAQRLLNRPSPALAYLTKAVFPFYILHQTIIILVGYPLISAALPVWQEASIVTLATVLGCLALYEVAIRRLPPLWPAMGLGMPARRR